MVLGIDSSIEGSTVENGEGCSIVWTAALAKADNFIVTRIGRWRNIARGGMCGSSSKILLVPSLIVLILRSIIGTCIPATVRTSRIPLCGPLPHRTTHFPSWRSSLLEQISPSRCQSG